MAHVSSQLGAYVICVRSDRVAASWIGGIRDEKATWESCDLLNAHKTAGLAKPKTTRRNDRM